MALSAIGQVRPRPAVRRLRACAGAVSALAIAATLQGPAQAQSLQLFQDSYEWFGKDNSPPTVTPFSRWGSVIVDYQSGMGQNFLNVSVNGVWQASNVQLFQFGAPGQSNTVSYHFGISGVEGPVGDLSLGYSITAAPLTDAPVETLTVQPLERWVGIAGGYGDAGAKAIPQPPAPPPVPPLTPPLDPGPDLPVVLGPDFPQQECGPNQCGAVAISSNLTYLNLHGANIPDNLTSLSFIAEQFGRYETDENGDLYYAGFNEQSFEDKAEFYAHYGIRTELWITLRRAIEIYRRGGVLELAVGGGFDANGDPLDGHVVPVTGLSQWGNRVTLTVLDDTRPNAPGGVIEEIIVIDETQGKVWGPSWVTNRTSLSFIGESVVPEPATWSQMLLGFLAIGALARRGRRAWARSAGQAVEAA